METVQAAELPEGIRELPIVAGDLALDFANTVDDPLGPFRFDHIHDYRSLLVWARRVDLLPAAAATTLLEASREHPRLAKSAVRRAALLREALNATGGALVEGDPPSAGWRELRPFVTTAIEHAEFGTPGAPRAVAWEFEELESLLWPVAHAAYDLLTGPQVLRLKRCAGCPWLFLDQSKNGSRRWCSMEICGTNEKIRRYVTRRAERRTS